MIELSKRERAVALKIKQLKDAAGSHSPSIFTIAKALPRLDIKVDACFLSNPYATDLFMKHLKKEIVETNNLREMVEFYPSQNDVIAKIIGRSINTCKENIFVGNGAIEAIQAVMHRFIGKKIIVNIPTFSPYYEFAKKDVEVVYYQLEKESNYTLNAEKYLKFVKTNKPDTVVIINPNNPTGGYLKRQELRYLVENLKEIENIVIDESFMHFAFEDKNYSLLSAVGLSKEFSNVIVIKSMSKAFGIAGIRAGYAVMDKRKVEKLLKNGYLWNIGGLAEYFFQLYKKSGFVREYESVRKKYIYDTQMFFDELSGIEELKVYPSKANFAIVELLDRSNSTNFVSKMLIKYGVYTRTCSDKIGLNGEFVRIASRTKIENRVILKSIIDMFESS